MRDDEPDELPAPKSAGLAAMYWRSEILQVMYWLRGEGFGDLVDVPMIERFLGMHAEVGITYLDQLVEQDYLVREGDWFALESIVNKTNYLIALSYLQSSQQPHQNNIIK